MIQRYSVLNEFYIIDNLTQKKYDHMNICDILNNYEFMLPGEIMNQDNQTLQVLQRDIAYCKKQLELETDPHIRQKIQHYLDALHKEEELLLSKDDIVLDDIEVIE